MTGLLRRVLDCKRLRSGNAYTFITDIRSIKEVGYFFDRTVYLFQHFRISITIRREVHGISTTYIDSIQLLGTSDFAKISGSPYGCTNVVLFFRLVCFRETPGHYHRR